ncbi:MAG: 4Fe-4S binding protein [Desulfomicrobium escambiense]|nr:4Fe-4S binding protein [Desulfomicrobium escambiense]
MCSDPGQELIQKDIKEAQSRPGGRRRRARPLMHENTFRTAMRAGGRQRVSLPRWRTSASTCSWVHHRRRRGDARRRRRLVARRGPARATYLEPLEKRSVPINPRALVIGGGIAGIQAALDACRRRARRSYLVEREPSIGGHMAKFDKTFPTLDCAACILTPKMVAGRLAPEHHPAGRIPRSPRSTDYVGNFTVTITRQGRATSIEELCTGCQASASQALRRARSNAARRVQRRASASASRSTCRSRRPSPQVRRHRSGTPAPTFTTGKCKQTCVEGLRRAQRDRLRQEDRIRRDRGRHHHRRHRASRRSTRRACRYYGYGTLPERLHRARGRAAGQRRPGPTERRDRPRATAREPKAVGIIHCIGSRDKNTNEYCSRVCCMYSLKLAHLIKEKTDAEVYNFYIDMRAPGKGYEEFYDRLLERGRAASSAARSARSPTEPIDRRGGGQAHRAGRGHAARRRARDPGRHGRARAPALEAADGRAGRAPDVQHELRQRRASSSSGTRSSAPVIDRHRRRLHRRLLPGAEGHPGHRRAGVGAAAARRWRSIDQAAKIEMEPATACDRRGGVLRLPDLHQRSARITRSRSTRNKKVSIINEALCKGCGTCVAACPSSAIGRSMFSDEQIFAEIEGSCPA